MFENNNVIIVIAIVIVGCYIMSKRNQKEKFAVLDNIRDGNRQCQSWARRNECVKNPFYMLPNCPKSCGNMRLAKTCVNLRKMAMKSGNKQFCDKISDALCKKYYIYRRGCKRSVDYRQSWCGRMYERSKKTKKNRILCKSLKQYCPSQFAWNTHCPRHNK